jgi:HEPN domain-containing protein
MNIIVKECVAKAEEDYHAALRLHYFSHEPTPSVVCFLAQQCAEKYLKAFLTQNNVPFRKTHDLEELLDLIVPLSSGFESIRDLLLLLNDYAVDIRYPGEMAVPEEAEEAVKALKTVRALVRERLDLRQ